MFCRCTTIATIAVFQLLSTSLTHAVVVSGLPVVGDLNNGRAAIDFGNPSYGYAQEFTITSGTWNIYQAWFNIGEGDGLPGPPLLQVRNSLGAGQGPGNTVLGAFTLNPNDIPTGFNFANVLAPANQDFILGPGTYWFCFGNDQPTGGPWIPFADTSTLAQGGVAGIVTATAPAQSSDGGQTFGSPSLGGYSLIFELDATPVPEPGTVALLGLGGLLIISRIRRSLPSPTKAGTRR